MFCASKRHQHLKPITAPNRRACERWESPAVLTFRSRSSGPRLAV